MEFPFTQDHEQATILSSHLNPLPRSVLRTNTFTLLDGVWNFALDRDDIGLTQQWYQGYAYGETAHWPGSLESHLLEASAAQSQPGASWGDTVVAWYERTFTVPSEWHQAKECDLQITFGACGYETRVWLNGQSLRTVDGEETHYGGYTSFSYEIPFTVLQPENRLTVRIAASLDGEIPRGKQESRVYQRGGIWYQTLSGAVRSIWIEPIERNRLRTRLRMRSQIESNMVEFHITTRILDPGQYTVHCAIALRNNAELRVVDTFPLHLSEGEQGQWIPMKLPEAELWSPTNPALYQLVIQLVGADGVVSQIETHFGVRHVATHDQIVYLNDKALYLDGILYQQGTASYAQMRQHFIAMKLLGCNLVRVHIAGVDPRIYDLADELGLLLWVEVPSPHTSSQRSRANHYDELQRELIVIGSHPSIIILSLYNEDWGAQDIASSVETREYIAHLFDYMRLHYPDLLVVDNDGWHHISHEGQLTTDLLTAHIYNADVPQWQAVLDRLVEGQNEGVAVLPLVVGDPFFYRGQAALVVSEWGGFGFNEYSGPVDVAAKVEQIRSFKRELRSRPIAGDVYTQAISIEDENNGIIDAKTGTLLVPPGVLHTDSGE